MWKGLDLKDVHGMLLGVHEPAQLASSGLSVLTELLHMFRHFVGSRTPEWWKQTLEGSNANSVPSDEAVAILSLVAAQAGGLTLPELAPLERPALLPTYLQLSVVVAVLIHFHGDDPSIGPGGCSHPASRSVAGDLDLSAAIDGRTSGGCTSRRPAVTAVRARRDGGSGPTPSLQRPSCNQPERCRLWNESLHDLRRRPDRRGARHDASGAPASRPRPAGRQPAAARLHRPRRAGTDRWQPRQPAMDHRPRPAGQGPARRALPRRPRCRSCPPPPNGCRAPATPARR